MDPGRLGGTVANGRMSLWKGLGCRYRCLLDVRCNAGKCWDG